MADPNADQNQGSVGGGVLEQLGCADCAAQTGLASRFFIAEGILGTIVGGLAGLALYTICCPGLIFSSYGLQFHRVLLSWSLSPGLLSGLFAVLTLWQLSRGMEDNRGSLWFGATILSLSLLANLLLLVLGAVFGLLAGSGFFLYGTCAGGLWPAAFGLMALDCMRDGDTPRRICCFPCEVPSKYYPPVMLLLFTLMMQAIDGGMIAGLLCGYAMHYRQSLQLSLTTASRWEQSPKLAFITQRASYRPASGAGVQVAAGGGDWAANNRSNNSGPPSRFATVHSSGPSVGSQGASSSSSSSAAAPSVFSGQGHRLGGPSAPPPSAAGSSSLLSFVNPFGSSAASAPPADASMGGAASAGDSAAAEAARRQRAAAFDKRVGKASTSPKQSAQMFIPKTHAAAAAAGTAGATATATSPRAPSAPSAAAATASSSSASSAARPPSPSRARADSAVFSLGLDDDEEPGHSGAHGDEDGDDLEQQRQASARRQQQQQQDEEEDESHGFVQGKASGGKKGKKGYAAVGSGAAEEDDEEEEDEGDASHDEAQLSSLRVDR